MTAFKQHPQSSAILVLQPITHVILQRGIVMSTSHCYQKIEVVGSSTTSIEEAIENAISHCDQINQQLDWFEVTETRGHIVDGKVGHYQVSLKVGFRMPNQH